MSLIYLDNFGHFNIFMRVLLVCAKLTHFALISEQAYVKEVDVHKGTLLLVNKADLLPASVRFEYLFFGLFCFKSLLLNSIF